MRTKGAKSIVDDDPLDVALSHGHARASKERAARVRMHANRVRLAGGCDVIDPDEFMAGGCKPIQGRTPRGVVNSNGEFYASARIASESTGVTRQAIQQSCNAPTSKGAKSRGARWWYISQAPLHILSLLEEKHAAKKTPISGTPETVAA